MLSLKFVAPLVAEENGTRSLSVVAESAEIPEGFAEVMTGTFAWLVNDDQGLATGRVLITGGPAASDMRLWDVMRGVKMDSVISMVLTSEAGGFAHGKFRYYTDRMIPGNAGVQEYEIDEFEADVEFGDLKEVTAAREDLMELARSNADVSVEDFLRAARERIGRDPGLDGGRSSSLSVALDDMLRHYYRRAGGLG
jgi:hypothetical protein